VVTAPPAFLARFSDPEQLMGAIRGADLDPCQLTGSPAVSEISRISFAGSTLDTSSLGPGFAFTGTTARDCFTLIYSNDCPQPAKSFHFSITHGPGILGWYQPGGDIEVITPAGFGTITLTIPTVTFLTALATHFPEATDSILSRSAALMPDPAALRQINNLVAGLRPLAESQGQDPDTARILALAETEVIDAFAVAFRSGCSAHRPASDSRLSRRFQKLRATRDFIHAHLGQPLCTNDLCAAVGLSRRGLETLCRDLLDISPKTYLLHQRLHGVRRCLIASEPKPGTIKRIALEWGFWHLGRFAADYRTLFGEGPTRTLARRRGTMPD
jgi:AraC family ethanolamine operon transcriptional activator